MDKIFSGIALFIIFGTIGFFLPPIIFKFVFSGYLSLMKSGFINSLATNESRLYYLTIAILLIMLAISSVISLFVIDASPTVKTILIAIFCLIGFIVGPILIKFAIASCIGSIKSGAHLVLINYLAANERLFFYIFCGFMWTIFALGLIIGIPAMFLDMGNSSSNSNANVIIATAPAYPPEGLPPLQLQVDRAGIILLAKTIAIKNPKNDDLNTSYQIVDILKSPSKQKIFNKGKLIKVSTDFFKQIGYSPKNNEKVIIFIEISDLARTITPFEILILTSDGEIFYPSFGAKDPSFREELNINKLKKMIKSNHKLEAA